MSSITPPPGDYALETCPDCGSVLPPQPGPAHAYLGATPSCWALYGAVLAREYGDPALRGEVHRLSVDAYAAQHPGSPGRRAAQSVWVHLTGLHLGLERQLAPAFIRRAMAALTSEADPPSWLTPPASRGAITVVDIAAAPDNLAHAALVRRWAEDVWDAWAEHHEAVRSLADRIGARL